MPCTSIGVAVAGFTHTHAAMLCEELATRDDVRLLAAWDEDAELGRSQSARFEMEQMPSVEDLLARDDVDAVIVATETSAHADVCVAACEAGKAVLCQKPMATTLEDCDRIVEAVESSGAHFQMAFQMRCDPLNLKIKEWVESGAIGKVGAIRRRHCIPMLLDEDWTKGAGKWHFDAQKNIGMFFDDAIHAADFLLWIMGRPHSVMAEIGNTLTDVAPDDCGMAIFRWPGAMGTLFNSSVALAGENTCEIYGDAGVIIQNFDDLVSTSHAPAHATALKRFDRASQSWETFEHTLPPNHGARIKAVAHDWIEKLKSHSAPTVSAREGKVSVEMCLAAYRSAREGRRIEL